MAQYTGPSTDNEAEMLATTVGRTVPDIFATDDQCKFQDRHAKKIHNDLSRYTEDTPEGWVT
jgi:hypothetical protein